MKPFSPIVAAVTLVLAVMATVTLIPASGTSPYSLFRAVKRYDQLLATIILVLIVLTIIFAVISAVTSPQARLTRAVFCGLTVLFGLVGLSTTLTLVQDSAFSPVPATSSPVFWFAVFMAGIAIPCGMTIALARNAALLYGAYGLAMPMWLLSSGLLILDLFLKFYK